MTGPDVHRMTVLASRAKTRVNATGDRGVLDITHDETVAMAFFCNLFLKDYPGPLCKGEPDLTFIPTLEMENTP